MPRLIRKFIPQPLVVAVDVTLLLEPCMGVGRPVPWALVQELASMELHQRLVASLAAPQVVALTLYTPLPLLQALWNILMLR